MIKVIKGPPIKLTDEQYEYAMAVLNRDGYIIPKDHDLLRDLDD